MSRVEVKKGSTSLRLWSRATNAGCVLAFLLAVFSRGGRNGRRTIGLFMHQHDIALLQSGRSGEKAKQLELENVRPPPSATPTEREPRLNRGRWDGAT